MVFPYEAYIFEEPEIFNEAFYQAHAAYEQEIFREELAFRDVKKQLIESKILLDLL